MSDGSDMVRRLCHIEERLNDIEKRLNDLELIQGLLCDIPCGRQPRVARALLAYSEIQAINDFMKWTSHARPSTWDDLATGWRKRLPHRSAEDLAALWQAYRDEIGDAPIFRLRPNAETSA